MQLVRTGFSDRIGTIAFDNYTKRNALSGALFAEVLAALDRFKTDGAQAVILEQLLRAVKAFPAPVIALVHGSAWGGACDLVMAYDIVIADETGAFAITPASSVCHTRQLVRTRSSAGAGLQRAGLASLSLKEAPLKSGHIYVQRYDEIVSRMEALSSTTKTVGLA